MKAIVKVKNDIGLELLEVPKPEINSNEVLIKITAASICGSDVPIMFWDDPWTMDIVKSGQTIGHEFFGEIVRIGDQVDNFERGMIVTAEGHIFCGECYQCRTGHSHICVNQKIVGFNYPGAFAEYIKIPARNVIRILDLPNGLGAIYDPLGNAVHVLSKVNVLNRSIFISGCGPIGLFSIIFRC